MSDVVEAVCAYLETFTTIKAAVSGAVFGHELPRVAVTEPAAFKPEEMPRAAIVVIFGGGGHLSGKDRLPRYDSIIDIYAYGSTRLEANDIAQEALEAMRELTETELESIRLFWARIAGGPTPGIDKQETDWPFALVTCQVMHGVGAISESISG